MRLVIDMQGAQTGSRFRGIGRYSLSIAKAIARIGSQHEILIALSDSFPESLPSIRAEFADLLPRKNVRVWHTVGPTREIDPENNWRRSVAERIREAFLASLQPDVVLVTSVFEGFTDDATGSVGLLGQKLRTAVILYDLIPFFYPDDQFRDSARLRAWYYEKIQHLKRSDLLLAISENSRQEALRAGLFPSRSVVSISGACDESFRALPLSADEKIKICSRFNIDKPFLMYTGGGDERKNLHRLIEAYAAMSREIRSAFQLVFAGKMTDENVLAYRETAKLHGLIDNELLFTGYVTDEDLVKLYNVCELFVFPSLHEGLGLPPLEAMACGAPVIGSNSTSLPEVIGLPEALFDPLSVPAMKSKMELALVDKRFRKRLIEHGSAQCNKFSWSRSAEIALASLTELAGDTEARPSQLLNVDRTSRFERRKLRILAIKMDHLGDFILAIPALSKLRARYPYARIDLVVGSWNMEVARELKFFENVYAFDFFRRKSSDPPEKNAEALAALLKTMPSYDIALDLRRQADTRFVLAQIDAIIKVGYATFDPMVDRLLDVCLEQHLDVSYRVNPLNRTSISVQMLRVVDAIPYNANDFVTFPEIGEPQISEEGRIAIFPKAGSAVREWNKVNFEKLLSLIARDPLVTGIDIYFANEREAAEFTFESQRNIQINIGLSFANLASSLARNRVCVANNSGGVHLASYLGVRVIGIYSGHELPSEWGPQFFDGIVIHRGAQCSPCHGGQFSDCPNSFFCLTDISVEDVYRKIVEALRLDKQNSKSADKTPSLDMYFQQNTDTIVNNLLSSIAELKESKAHSTVDAVIAISSNHQDFLMTPDLTSFPVNTSVDHRSPRIEWRGFSGIERKFRWTDGNASAMLFECPEGVPAIATVLLRFDTLGPQRLTAKMNGRQVVEETYDGRRIALKIPVTDLRSGTNSLEFELPDAKVPGNGDTRRLGIAVREIRIQVDDYRPLSNVLVASHKSGQVEWHGFSAAESEFRWTDGQVATMLFDIPPSTPNTATLRIQFDTFGSQHLICLLNGLRIMDATKSGTRVVLVMRVKNLKPGQNALELQLPDAQAPGNGDDRQLGVAIRTFRVQVELDSVES